MPLDASGDHERLVWMALIRPFSFARAEFDTLKRHYDRSRPTTMSWTANGNLSLIWSLFRRHVFMVCMLFNGSRIASGGLICLGLL